MDDLERAAALLQDEGAACVILHGDTHISAAGLGVRPLLQYRKELSGAVVADKVVGKAAALLAIAFGVRALYGAVMSKPAEAVLRRHGMPFAYGMLVSHIVNRTGDGVCPLEAAVWDIDDPAAGVAAVEQKVAELMKNK